MVSTIKCIQQSPPHSKRARGRRFHTSILFSLPLFSFNGQAKQKSKRCQRTRKATNASSSKAQSDIGFCHHFAICLCSCSHATWIITSYFITIYLTAVLSSYSFLFCPVEEHCLLFSFTVQHYHRLESVAYRLHSLNAKVIALFHAFLLLL